MNKIRLVTTGDTKSIFWDTLGKILINEAGIELKHCYSEHELVNSLYEKPHALLLEQSSNTEKKMYESFYNVHPGLSIFAFDPGGEETVLRIRNMGQHLFVRLIETLAAEDNVESSQSKPQFKLIRSGHREDSIPRPINEIEQENDYQLSADHMSIIQQWIDLKLYERLVNDQNAQEANIPGWAMNADRARSLLGENLTGKSDINFTEAIEQLESNLYQNENLSLTDGYPSKLQNVVNAFSLDKFEQQVLYFVLAPEIDGRYAQIFGYLNDDFTRRRPTVSLLAQLLFDEKPPAWHVRQKLSNSTVFSQYRLIRAENNETLSGAELGLSLCSELIQYLLLSPDSIPNYGNYINIYTSALNPVSRQFDDDRQSKLRVWWNNGNGCTPNSVIQLVGNQSALSWFRQQWNKISRYIVEFHVNRNENTVTLSEQCHSAVRIALLHNSPLLITGLSDLANEQLDALALDKTSKLVPHLIIHSDQALVMPGMDNVWCLERVTGGVNQRSRIWQTAANRRGIKIASKDVTHLAAVLKFDELDIDATLSLCNTQTVVPSGILSAARRISRREIPRAIRRVEPKYSWTDIVLPADVVSQLAKIPLHIRHAGEVMEKWNYQSRVVYGQGVTALFSGASGTGKTMAAQIIAAEIGVELFQVDLSKLVSKYIGETEKNLESIFDAAEKASAVLLFDEADAIFGKRTEIRDAHDRYANVEVAYLLQRMESYTGLALLTTNLRQNLDTAFMRRLRFVIDFPLPKAQERETIWRQVFPAEAPLDNNVEFAFLARSLELTGGNIQQIAIRAAFSAVANNTKIGMQHIIQATREELQRLGMKSKEILLPEQYKNGMSA